MVVSILAAQRVPPPSLALATEQVAATPSKLYKLAGIFPGVITDADYNTLGYIGVTAVQTGLDIEVAYSETVAVPDVERAMREYIEDGYVMIFAFKSVRAPAFLGQNYDRERRTLA